MTKYQLYTSVKLIDVRTSSTVIRSKLQDISNKLSKFKTKTTNSGTLFHLVSSITQLYSTCCLMYHKITSIEIKIAGL